MGVAGDSPLAASSLPATITKLNPGVDRQVMTGAQLLRYQQTFWAGGAPDLQADENNPQDGADHGVSQEDFRYWLRLQATGEQWDGG